MTATAPPGTPLPGHHDGGTPLHGCVRIAEVPQGGCIQRICLNDACGVVLVDGHFELHRSASRAEAAIPLLLRDDVIPLALAVADHLKCFSSAGWDITVVFDGDSPPSKSRTAQAQSSGRTEALELFRRLSPEFPTNRDKLEAAGKNAVSFSPHIVARVARVLRHVLPCK